MKTKINNSLLLLYIIFFYLFSTLVFAANCGGSTPCNCGDTIIENYTMTSDLSCSGTALTIGADHITLDCQGYTINHTGSGSGINASGRTNITIKNCNIIGSTSVANNYGIYFYSTSNSFILNNNLNSNYDGIYLGSSSNNSISNINASNNGDGIYIDYNSNYNTLSNITASSNNYGIYLSSSSNYNTLSNITVSNNLYGIYLSSSSNNSLSNITASNNIWYGISLFFSSSNFLSNITASNNTWYGIYLSSSSSNSLSNITVTNSSQYGIYLSSSSSNSLSNITATNNNEAGIYLSSSSSNFLSNITASNNTWYGISLYSSSSNSLSNITASNNTYGILLDSSSSNFLSNITASNNSRGIHLSSSSSNSLSNITASNNTYGILLDSSSSNFLSNITASNNTWYGILLDSSSSNFLSNITASNNTWYGISLYSSSNNSISNINASNNTWYGISIFFSSNNTLSQNNMSNNRFNLHINGNEETQNIDTSNLVDGKPVYWLKNVQNQVFVSSTNAGLFACFNCNNITVKDLTFEKNSYGVLFKGTNNSFIFNITASNNTYGILLDSSSSNSLSNITASNNSRGIHLFSSSSNSLSNITASNNSRGIHLFSSSNNSLSNITASNNSRGIYLYSSSNNTIYNSFFNNTNNVYFDGTIYENFWNTTLNCSAGPNIIGGPCIGGNFYATPSGNGFSETCTDSDGNGICDSEYYLQTDNIDYLPLAAYTAPSDTTPPSVQILSPSNNTWHRSDINVTILAIDDTSTQILCRVYLNNNNVENLTLSNNSPLTIFRSLPNGKNYVYLNCSDQAGNSNISNLIIIYFDNINPTISSFTLSSSVVYVGDTITYNCTASDNSESYEGSVTTSVTGIDTSSVGTKTARCTAIDTAGNSIYEEITYTVNQIILPPSGGGGGGCSPVWQCSEWSECSKEGIRTRTCIDINNCGTTTDKPSETAACIYACMPDWRCSPWSECSPSGIQTRTCIDNNNCGLLSPSTSRSCLYIPKELTANLDQTDLNAISAIQSNFINLFQSLEDKDYNKIESYFSSAIEQTNFLLRTSPTTNNLNISQTVINNGLQLSDYLIQQEHFSSSSIILSNISSTIPFLSQIDASYANKLTNSLLQKSSQFFSANKPDELISFLNSLIQSLKQSFQSQFKLIDELQRNRLDPNSLLRLNELGTSIQLMSSALSDLDDASEIILQASTEANAEKKFQLLSQSLNLIQQSMLKFPEINRILSYSVDQDPSEITYQSIISNIPEDERQRLEEMKNSTDSEKLTVMKSVFSYSLKNEEYTDKETSITIIKLSVISPSQLDNLIIYEYIPKGISISDIQSPYNFTILNEDPIIQFNLGSVALGETKSVIYTINRKLPSYSSQSYSIGLIHTGIPYLPTPEEIVFSDSTHNIRLIAAILITLFILLEFYLTKKSTLPEFRLFKY